MNSGRLADYIGKGAASSRPASLSLHPDMVGLYYATDTDEWSAWDGTVWKENIMSGGGGGGGIPDAPSDGYTYGRKNAAWEQIASGGDVTGPAGAAADRIAVFDGATGKLIKDGGLTVADLYFDTISAPAISSGTVTLNCDSGRVRNFTVSMTDNATLAVSNLTAAGRVTEFECLIAQDATGSRTLTLPASFRPLGGSDTAIAAAAGAKTVLSAKTFDAGTTWVYAMQEVG